MSDERSSELDEAREWVQGRRAQERGETLPSPSLSQESEGGSLGSGGMDPTGSESVLDWAIESDELTPVKFRFDW